MLIDFDVFEAEEILEFCNSKEQLLDRIKEATELMQQ